MNTTTQIRKPAIILCGDWYDPEESTQLVRAPQITVDPATSQLYATVGDEPAERVIESEVSYMLGTIAIRTIVGEIFIVALADCPALPGV